MRVNYMKRFFSLKIALGFRGILRKNNDLSMKTALSDKSM